MSRQLNKNYRVPETLVYQSVSSTTTVTESSMRSFLVGPHAQLCRYAESSEKEDGYLGYYTGPSTKVWDNRETNSTLDESYTRMFIEKPLLEYYKSATDSGNGIVIPKGSFNTLYAADRNFVSNVSYGASHGRSESIVRNVKVGDIVKIEKSDDSTVTPVFMSIIGTENESESLSIDATTKSLNALTTDGNTSADISLTTSRASSGITAKITSVTKINKGMSVNVRVAASLNSSSSSSSSSSTAYRFALMASTDVITSSTSEISVQSGTWSNNSLVVNYIISGATATALGITALQVTFTRQSSSYDFVEGDQFNGVVRTPFVRVVASEESIISQATATTSTIEIKASADVAFSDAAFIDSIVITDQKTGTALTGTFDSATNTLTIDDKYTVVLAAESTDLTVWGLKSGDTFILSVKPSTALDYNTLVLNKNLPSALQSSTDDIAVTITIYATVTCLELPSVDAADESVYWLADNDGINIYAGWKARLETDDDAGYIDAPIYSDADSGYGKLYVQYRSWNTSTVGSLYTISSTSDLNSVLSGSTSPDNTLKYAVSKALENHGTVPVLIAVVANPDSADSWQEALDLASNRRDIYNYVPLTNDKAVQDKFVTFVNANSNALNAMESVVWLNAKMDSILTIVGVETTSDSTNAEGLFAENPNISGRYNYFIVNSLKQNANFITNGVKSGDTLNIYGDESATEPSYTFTVKNVINESTLTTNISSIASSLTGSPRKFTITRTLSGTELATRVANSQTYDNERVRYVWPDTIVDTSYQTVPGYHLCAALAALSSAVVSHQGLTQQAISGFLSTPRSTNLLRGDLNLLGGNGVWVVVEDENGTVLTRHAVTTANYNELLLREEMTVRNMDYITKVVRQNIQGYIGTANITAPALAQINVAIDTILVGLSSSNSTARLGSRIISYSDLNITVDSLYSDRLIVEVAITIPSPLNNLDVYLTFGVSSTITAA